MSDSPTARLDEQAKCSHLRIDEYRDTPKADSEGIYHDSVHCADCGQWLTRLTRERPSHARMMMLREPSTPSEPDRDREADSLAVLEYFAVHCTGRPDCPVPHEQFARLFGASLPPSRPAVPEKPQEAVAFVCTPAKGHHPAELWFAEAEYPTAEEVKEFADAEHADLAPWSVTPLYAHPLSPALVGDEASEIARDDREAVERIGTLCALAGFDNPDGTAVGVVLRVLDEVKRLQVRLDAAPRLAEVEAAIQRFADACYEVGFADADRQPHDGKDARETRAAARAALLALYRPAGETK